MNLRNERKVQRLPSPPQKPRLPVSQQFHKYLTSSFINFTTILLSVGEKLSCQAKPPSHTFWLLGSTKVSWAVRGPRNRDVLVNILQETQYRTAVSMTAEHAICRLVKPFYSSASLPTMQWRTALQQRLSGQALPYILAIDHRPACKRLIFTKNKLVYTTSSVGYRWAGSSQIIMLY